jgi:adenosylmethionine-8-amino-7-oxononanoate aminotransferase
LVIRPLGGNRVAVCPPLIIETTHVDELIEKFGAALNLTLDWVTAEKLA